MSGGLSRAAKKSFSLLGADALLPRNEHFSPLFQGEKTAREKKCPSPRNAVIFLRFLCFVLLLCELKVASLRAYASLLIISKSNFTPSKLLDIFPPVDAFQSSSRILSLLSNKLNTLSFTLFIHRHISFSR